MVIGRRDEVMVMGEATGSGLCIALITQANIRLHR